MSATLKPTHLETLSLDEERDRLHLERRVERGFYEQGLALKQLHDRRLYRSTHSSWEGYLRDRFNMGRHNANYIIAAVTYVENIAQYQLGKLVTSGHQASAAAPAPASRSPENSALEVSAEVVTSGHQADAGAESASGPQQQQAQASFQLTWENLPHGLILSHLRKGDSPPAPPARRTPRGGLGSGGGEEWRPPRPPDPRSPRSCGSWSDNTKKQSSPPTPSRWVQVCTIHSQDHPELRGLGGAPRSGHREQ